MKPELILPAVLNKGNVNWAGDFVRLYKAIKERELSKTELRLLHFYKDFMPYLCTKVQLKEIDDHKLTSAADSANAARQTSELLKALEAEQNALKPVPPQASNP